MNGLSLIIPIYNIENYIEECLQSVVTSIKESFNIQIILVDDGSQDKSLEIALKFVEKYSFFIYIRKENGGLSDARNYGLKYAEYDYVAFLDGDDCITEIYFVEVFEVMHSEPDIIIFDWMDFGEGDYKQTVCGIELPEALWTIQPSAWNKVYKRSLFNEVSFPIGKIYEDVGTTYRLLHYVKNFVYINKPLYMYRKNRTGSILSTISPKINDIYDVLEETYLFYKEKKELSPYNLDGLCYQYVKILMWSNMYRQLKYYKLNIVGFHKKMKQTRSLIYTLFPDWKRNEYLLKKEDFFKGRFGNHFVERIDGLGKNIIKSILVTSVLILINRRRI